MMESESAPVTIPYKSEITDFPPDSLPSPAYDYLTKFNFEVVYPIVTGQLYSCLGFVLESSTAELKSQVRATFSSNVDKFQKVGSHLFDKYRMTEETYLTHVDDLYQPCDPLSCFILASVFSTHVLILFGDNVCWTSATDFRDLTSKNSILLAYIGNNEYIFLRDLNPGSRVHSGDPITEYLLLCPFCRIATRDAKNLEAHVSTTHNILPRTVSGEKSPLIRFPSSSLQLYVDPFFASPLPKISLTAYLQAAGFLIRGPVYMDTLFGCLAMCLNKSIWSIQDCIYDTLKCAGNVVFKRKSTRTAAKREFDRYIAHLETRPSKADEVMLFTLARRLESSICIVYGQRDIWHVGNKICDTTVSLGYLQPGLFVVLRCADPSKAHVTGGVVSRRSDEEQTSASTGVSSQLGSPETESPETDVPDPVLCCEKCDYQGTSSRDLRYHIRTTHLSKSQSPSSIDTASTTDNRQAANTSPSSDSPARPKKPSVSRVVPEKNFVLRRVKKYRCPVCPQVFLQSYKLNAHVWKRHGGLECRFEGCVSRFGSGEARRKHERSHDESQLPHACDECTRRFPNASALASHMRRHSEERPFKCHECVESFKHENDLRVHRDNFHGSIVYSCSHCEYTSSSKKNYEYHRGHNTHSDSDSEFE